MMLPILISESVAPGSYFFCAFAAPVSATASSPAIAADWTWLKSWWCIIVLPDVKAAALAVLIFGQLGVSRRINADSQYARTGGSCQQSLVATRVAISAERNKPAVP